MAQAVKDLIILCHRVRYQKREVPINGLKFDAGRETEAGMEHSKNKNCNIFWIRIIGFSDIFNLNLDF